MNELKKSLCRVLSNQLEENPLDFAPHVPCIILNLLQKCDNNNTDSEKRVPEEKKKS